MPIGAIGAGHGMCDLHQLFDAASSTFTYVLVDPGTRDTVIIDAVDADRSARAQ